MRIDIELLQGELATNKMLHADGPGKPLLDKLAEYNQCGPTLNGEESNGSLTNPIGKGLGLTANERFDMLPVYADTGRPFVPAIDKAWFVDEDGEIYLAIWQGVPKNVCLGTSRLFSTPEAAAEEVRGKAWNSQNIKQVQGERSMADE